MINGNITGAIYIKTVLKLRLKNITPPAPYLWIWISKLWLKLEVFAWLLLADRLSTRNMLKIRSINIGNDFTCPLCSSGEEETVEHLLSPFTNIRCFRHVEVD
jgi:hypothetical protein